MTIFPVNRYRFWRLALLAAAQIVLLAATLSLGAGPTQAGPESLSWADFAEHEVSARYWLDDDFGPETGAPQDDVDEQEHVY